MPTISSPSRTYVMMCNKTNFDGFYFRKFKLPKEYDNNAETASWYFFNRLDGFACGEKCMTIEDYNNINEVAKEEE